MRARPWLIAALGLNVVLASGWYLDSRRFAESAGSAVPRFSDKSTTQYKTNYVVRRQHFTWHDVESADYPTYIKKLREIGCPEQTIRDIIVADVNQLFSQRRAREVVSPEHQWWRSEPDMELLEEASQQVAALEEERRGLLTGLLGPEWEASSAWMWPTPGQGGFDFSGPVLGELAPETRLIVNEIARQWQEELDRYLEVQREQGKEADPLELARIRQASRTELARTLSPQEFEEFLLRYSNTAEALREQLFGVAVAPDEFRQLFHVLDPLEHNLAELTEAQDPTGRVRADLERHREEVLRQVLEGDRYETFQLGRDPLFREAQILARRLDAPPEVVVPIYEINQITLEQVQRVGTNPNIPPEQKAVAIREIQAEQAATLRQLLGPEAYERYLLEQTYEPAP